MDVVIRESRDDGGGVGVSDASSNAGGTRSHIWYCKAGVDGAYNAFAGPCGG